MPENTKILKLPATFYKGHHKLCGSTDAHLIRKPKGAAVIRVGDQILKLDDHRIKVNMLEGTKLEVSAQNQKVIITLPDKPSTLSTRDIHEFKKEVESARDEFCRRKSGSGGGFVPLNTLGGGSSTHGRPGERGKASLSHRLFPHKSSGPVSRNSVGLPSREARLPSNLPRDESPEDASRHHHSSGITSSTYPYASSSHYHHEDPLDAAISSRREAEPQQARSVPSPAPSQPFAARGQPSSPRTPPRKSHTEPSQRPATTTAASSSPDSCLVSGPPLGSRIGGSVSSSNLPIRVFGRFKPPFTSSSSSSSSIAAGTFSGLQQSKPRTSTSLTTTTTSGGALTGFPNLGNTCYLNAVLQSMCALPAFTNDLLSALWVTPMLPELQRAAAHTSITTTGEKKQPGVSGSSEATPGPDKALPRVYASLLRIILLSKRKDHGIIDPSPFRKAMSRYYPEYGSKNQQDAHEFLGDVINTLQEELCPIARQFAAAQLSSSSGKGAAMGGLHLFKGMEGGVTPARPPSLDDAITDAEVNILTQILPVSRNFHIEVVKTLTCPQCGYSRSLTEAFTDFSLDLVDHEQQHNHDDDDGKAGQSSSTATAAALMTIPNLLKGFFKEQVLELACEECGHNKVCVTFNLDKLPNVLVIHLKRFRLDGTLNQKLTTRVQAPTSIDLRNFCTRYTQNPTRQGALPKPVLEKDCSFLVAEQTPAPGSASSSSSVAADKKDVVPIETSDAFKEPVVGRPHSLQSPPAPKKMAAVLENRDRRQLNVALQKSQVDDRWGEEEEVEEDEDDEPLRRSGATPGSSSSSNERKKRKSLSPTGGDADGLTDREGSRKRACGGSGASVDAAIMLECDEDVVVLDHYDEEEVAAEVLDKDLQDAIQRSLQDQQQHAAAPGDEDAMQISDEHIEAPITLSQPLRPAAPALTEDKENVCPNSQPTGVDQQQQQSVQKPPPPSGGSSPFNLSLLTPASSSREQRGEREEPLQCNYDLKCVIRHLGKWAFSGHYIADVRTRDGGAGLAGMPPKVLWKRYDDSVVSTLSNSDQVLEEDKSLENGYIFFYTLKQ